LEWEKGKKETTALGGDSAALIGMNEKSVDAGGTLNLVRARQSFAERLRRGEIFEMVTSLWRSTFVGVSARPRSGLSVHRVCRRLPSMDRWTIRNGDDES
jgi:hypothetical protein